jgi:hypothetical protein
MCMGGGGQSSQPTVTPAAAPAPAAPAPVETQIGAARADQNKAAYGNTNGPNLRSDRSLNVPGGGAGLSM